MIRLWPFVGILAASLIDYLVKHRLFMCYLYPKCYDSVWDNVPAFWKDYIQGQHAFRLRWAFIPNIIGILLSMFLTLASSSNIFSILLNGMLYLYLGAINLEHIGYWWIMGISPIESWTLFDLPDKPTWMKQLSWNYWLAKLHKNKDNVVTSEEILTVALLGVTLYFMVFFVL